MNKENSDNLKNNEVQDLNSMDFESAAAKSEDEIMNQKKMKEDLQSNIDDNGLEEIILLKQAIDEKEETIENLRKELEDNKEGVLRVKAEFENFRKRMNKDKEEFFKYANQKIIEDILPILDNFDRALESGKTTDNFEAFYEGIGLIERSLYEMLDKKYSCKSVGKKGEPFDPLFHEAISIIEDPEVEGLIIEEVFQKGYVLHDRVVRTAKVVVKKGKEKTVSNNEKNEGETDSKDNQE